MNPLENLWNRVLTEMELSLSKANFTTWFQNTFILKESDGAIIVGVPNEFIKEWLHTKHHKDILRILRQENEHIRGVEYVVSKKDGAQKVQPQKDFSHRESLVPAMNQNHELPFGSLPNRKDNLNPRYTFDSFIVCPFNEIPYATAQTVLASPGKYQTNPFFVYGATGLGKTHLIQAIGNEFKRRYPSIHVYYTSIEKFQIDYVNALTSNRVHAFKEKYRTYDVLIIDDIQFISGKEKTQEELFHLFNILYDKNKQIIFSSDKHPNLIQGLDDRLKSRMGSGTVADFSKPEYESRIAILQSKAREHGITIPAESIDFIASHVEGNIRELEGILNSLLVQMQIKKGNLSIEDIKLVIRNNIKPKKNVPIEDIIRIIANFYNIDEPLMYEKTRRKEIVHCRQVAMFLLREDFNISFPLIGRKFGGRDHTTVIHSCEKIKGNIESDGILSREVEQLRAMLAT